MADELVERLLRTHITRSTFGGVAAGCFHDALVNPDGAKAAARIQSDAAEIARLRAELVESRGKAVADVAAWLRNWHYEGSLADDLETGKWERD